MDISNEDIRRSLEEYLAEQGSDEDRERLLAIIADELEQTQITIEQSPVLRGRGQSAICHDQRYRIDVMRELDILPDETIDDYTRRMWDESVKRGYTNVQDMMIENTQEDVIYWTLDVTDRVYIANRRIGYIEEDGTMRNSAIHLESQRDLEEIIQGLRLLRTPFNGAVVE